MTVYKMAEMDFGRQLRKLLRGWEKKKGSSLSFSDSSKRSIVSSLWAIHLLQILS